LDDFSLILWLIKCYINKELDLTVKTVFNEEGFTSRRSVQELWTDGFKT